MAVDQIEVFPETGQWYFREHTAAGAYKDRSDPYDDRSTAIEAARGAAGATGAKLFDESGAEVGFVRHTSKRVVLLRADGSEYGELDAAPPEDGASRQVVVVHPAISGNGAGEVV